jgi:hypothetical protein
MRFFVLTCLGIFLATAAFAPSQQSKGSTSFVESMGPPDENPQYFPTGVFSDNPESAEFSARWYAKHLRAMKEKSFLGAVANKDFLGYRFLWLRTFHHPISVRLQIRRDGSGQLTSIELTGEGGFQPGVILTTKTVELSKEQTDQFDSLVQASDFWKIPAHDPDEGGDDGAQWILEGVKDQKYQVVDRWSPRDGTYRQACLYLLKLSQIKVDPKEIY